MLQALPRLQLQSQTKAGRIAALTFDRIRKIIRPGFSEKQIAWQINKIMKSLGAESLAFATIVASGSGSSQPHHKNTARKIAANDIILLDFGCKINGFCSDFSRTIFIGTPKIEWLKVYKIVKKAQKKAMKQCNNETIKASDLDLVARDYITKKGYGKNFIHTTGHGIGTRDYITKKGYGKNFIHGLGHGIATRVHQYFKISPKSKAIIKPGMIFTIEPGIYLKNRFGVRIEDTIYWAKSGLKILTRS